MGIKRILCWNSIYWFKHFFKWYTLQHVEYFLRQLFWQYFFKKVSFFSNKISKNLLRVALFTENISQDIYRHIIVIKSVYVIFIALMDSEKMRSVYQIQKLKITSVILLPDSFRIQWYPHHCRPLRTGWDWI